MGEHQELRAIAVGDLVKEVSALKAAAYRLVQISATALKDTLELNYSFDLNFNFLNLRLVLPLKGPEIPSVSGIYFAAFIYENELHDLFGVNVTNIAVDYKGKFYRTAVQSPFVADKLKALSEAKEEV